VGTGNYHTGTARGYVDVGLLTADQKVAADVADVVKEPAMVERLRVLGIDPIGGDSRMYTSTIAADRVRYQKAVQVAGAKGE
jgi:polyphosphate kinase